MALADYLVAAVLLEGRPVALRSASLRYSVRFSEMNR